MASRKSNGLLVGERVGLGGAIHNNDSVEQQDCRDSVGLYGSVLILDNSPLDAIS
jgi:hypothetical protein